METTIRELKNFLNEIDEADLDSPVFIENESGHRFTLTDMNTVISKDRTTKMLLEFDSEKTTE
jgi:phosphoribulokinase